MKGERPTQARIDLAALASNFSEAERLADGALVIAVVKADAYGHGAVPVARRLVAAGARHLAVATVTEASELRAAAIETPILVLGGVHDAAEAADVAALGVTAVLHHPGDLPLLREAGRERGAPLQIQVEVDTGMRRMGLSPEDAPSLIERIAREPHLTLEGVYTHLAQADEPDLTPVREQLRLFREILHAVKSRGVDPGLVHVANSPALLAAADLADDLPAEVNAVRPGVMLYGICPAPHLADRAHLAPVMTLMTRVANVRHVRSGDTVGYGATWRAPARGRIATLPVGYADGIPRSLGSRGSALLRGRRVAFAGRISMDLLTLEVGDEDVNLGDPVVLFGRFGDRILPVEEVAAAAGTIAYEILARIGPRIPRIFEEGGPDDASR
jgi:alanine racemase